MNNRAFEPDIFLLAFAIIWLLLEFGAEPGPEPVAAAVTAGVGGYVVARLIQCGAGAFLGGVVLLLIPVAVVLSAMTAAALTFVIFALLGLAHCVASRIVDLVEPWVVRAGAAWDRLIGSRRSDRSDSASEESEREKSSDSVDAPTVPSRRGAQLP